MKKTEKKKTLFIKKKAFCEWLFDKNMFHDGTFEYVIDTLIEKGKITLQNCLNGISYIPSHLIINQENMEQLDKNEFEVETPRTKYVLKFPEIP